MRVSVDTRPTYCQELYDLLCNDFTLVHAPICTALDFQFSQEVVSVAEENGTVSVCVEIASDGNLFRNVEIGVVPQNGSTGNYSYSCSVAMLFTPPLYRAG